MSYLVKNPVSISKNSIIYKIDNNSKIGKAKSWVKS